MRIDRSTLRVVGLLASGALAWVLLTRTPARLIVPSELALALAFLLVTVGLAAPPRPRQRAPPSAVAVDAAIAHLALAALGERPVEPKAPK